MGAIKLNIHPLASFVYAPIDSLVGVLNINSTENAGENGGEPATVKGLAFIDPDGEGHIYVLTDPGRQRLIETLTGGVVIP